MSKTWILIIGVCAYFYWRHHAVAVATLYPQRGQRSTSRDQLFRVGPFASHAGILITSFQGEEMNKETEKILLWVVGGYVLLQLLTRTSSAGNQAITQAQIDSKTNLGYAADATSIVNSLIGG